MLARKYIVEGGEEGVRRIIRCILKIFRGMHRVPIQICFGGDRYGSLVGLNRKLFQYGEVARQGALLCQGLRRAFAL